MARGVAAGWASWSFNPSLYAFTVLRTKDLPEAPVCCARLLPQCGCLWLSRSNSVNDKILSCLCRVIKSHIAISVNPILYGNMWNKIIYFNSYIVMSRLKQWQLQNSVFPQYKNSLNIDAYISVLFKNIQKIKHYNFGLKSSLRVPTFLKGGLQTGPGWDCHSKTLKSFQKEN